MADKSQMPFSELSVYREDPHTDRNSNRAAVELPSVFAAYNSPPAKATPKGEVRPSKKIVCVSAVPFYRIPRSSVMRFEPLAFGAGANLVWITAISLSRQASSWPANRQRHSQDEIAVDDAIFIIVNYVKKLYYQSVGVI